MLPLDHRRTTSSESLSSNVTTPNDDPLLLYCDDLRSDQQIQSFGQIHWVP